jgi:hypothetical protein
MMALIHMAGFREFRMHMKNPAQTGSGCIRFNDLNFHQATFAKYSSALFPFPTSLQYFSLICDPFADPIISLHSRDISLFDCHI